MDVIAVQMVEQKGVNTGGQAVQNTKSGKDTDFGSMVRQKQEGRSSQDSADKTQTSQKGQKSGGKDQASQERAAASQAKTEVTTEQYGIAAAMMMLPGVQFLEIFTRNQGVQEQVEVKEAVEEDFHPEAVQETPERQEDDRPEYRIEFGPAERVETETFEEVVEEVVEEVTEAVEEVGEEEETEETVEVEEVVVEQPLFANVETAPVKVAEPEAEEPVDLTQPRDVERMAAKIETLIVNQHGESRVEFSLIPENLGKITVEILRTQDGALHISLAATTTRAAELLGRNTGNLQHLLGADVRPAVDVQVRTTEDEAVRQLLNPDGQQEQQRQQQQRKRKDEEKGGAQDFIQQLRLGLVSLAGE